MRLLTESLESEEVRKSELEKCVMTDNYSGDSPDLNPVNLT